MVYKKVYDENKGIYIYVDPWTGQADSRMDFEGSEGYARGSGIFDALTSVGQKIFSSSVKEISKKALETAGKQALESGAKKIGSEVGNLAANKIANVISRRVEDQGPIKSSTEGFVREQKKPPGEMIIKELKKLPLRSRVLDEDINMRINKILSGSGRVPRSNIQMRVNKLLL